MAGFFGSLIAIEKVFLISAVLGGFLFIGRMILMFIGGHHGDGDAGGDGGFDAHSAGHGDGDIDTDHGDSDSSFKFISMQGLTAFFMMFGLVGLALSRQSKLPEVWAIFGAVVAGLFCVWVIGKIMTSMIHLQSEGTLDIKNAVGNEGLVYLTIPADGQGVVQISVQDTLRELSAISQDKVQIKTGQRIVVNNVIGNLLVVKQV
jgi:membrane protein implicated in regulation of membrane protease activity